MKAVREYPVDNDPILRFFVEDDIPQTAWLVEPQERAQRFRYALIAMCAGLHPLVAWATAFAIEPEIEAAIESTLSEVDDALIEEMVRDSRREARLGLS